MILPKLNLFFGFSKIPVAKLRRFRYNALNTNYAQARFLTFTMDCFILNSDFKSFPAFVNTLDGIREIKIIDLKLFQSYLLHFIGYIPLKD